MDSVQLVGRLTRNPALTYTKTDKAVCKFSIAVNDRYTKEHTNFFDVTAWGKQGELINEYFEKGKQIALTGRLRQDRWEDDSGQKRSKVYVVMENFTFIGSKETKAAEPTAEDVPF